MTHHNPSSDMGPSYWAYLKKFEYRVTVQLGRPYTSEFKEFSGWCDQHMGEKYKDWFIADVGKGRYTLFARNTKRTTFLTLMWVDKIV
jgi:hypothetical protein